MWANWSLSKSAENTALCIFIRFMVPLAVVNYRLGSLVSMEPRPWSRSGVLSI